MLTTLSKRIYSAQFFWRSWPSPAERRFFTKRPVSIGSYRTHFYSSSSNTCPTLEPCGSSHFSASKHSNTFSASKATLQACFRIQFQVFLMKLPGFCHSDLPEHPVGSFIKAIITLECNSWFTFLVSLLFPLSGRNVWVPLPFLLVCLEID